MKKLYFFLFIISVTHCYSQTVEVKRNLYLQSGMYQVNGNLLFAADTGTYKDDLWISDGTTGGTHVLKTFKTTMLQEKGVGFGTYVPIVYKGELYFLADSTTGGYAMALWKSDGTAQGTTLVKDFNGQMNGPYGDSYPFFCILNNELLFAAGDGSHGVELWKTDGTPNGTVMVKDIATDNNLGSQPSHLTNYKNEVYFSCWNETYGVEIWKTDGTDVGTQILKDILPGPRAGVTNDGYGGSIDPQFTVSGNYLFFTGSKDTLNSGTFLYRTDGTSSGTIILDTSNFKYDPLSTGKPYQVDVNGEYMYIGNPASGINSSLYKSDGTPSGTVNVATNNNLTVLSTLFSFNGKLYFHGAQGVNYSDDGLCVSDGTTNGTALVEAFPFAASSPETDDFVSIGNSFFFRAELSVNSGQTDWRIAQSNGTNSGTIVYRNGVSCYGRIVYYKNDIYFAGLDSATSNIHSLYKLTPVATLGVPETPSQYENITAFPNPVDETIIINTSLAAGENVVLKVYNLIGETIYNTKFTAASLPIDVSDWKNGIYFCTLQQNQNIQTLKIIVQH